MGIFNWKQKNSANGERKQMAQGVKSAIKSMKEGFSPIKMEIFSNTLFECLSQKEWVPMLERDCGVRGKELDCRMDRGKYFVALFTDPSEIKEIRNGFSMSIMDISTAIDDAFFNEEIAGIVINPDTDGMYIEKYLLLKIILHSQYPMQTKTGSPRVDWGEGIPRYKESDLMTEDDFLDFAMHTVVDCECGKNGYTLISANNNPQVCPNLILQKNGDFVLVSVRGYCAPEEPQLNLEESQKLASLKQRFCTKCCYATVGFGSVDGDRFNTWLALRGDGYYARYLGLQELE